MASREKRPLAPSKSKQKANESTISSPDIKTKKGKTLPNLRQQIARDILEAVATGSQLPPKLEASLPRKKALEKLKRNQKLRSKVSLIKAKQKVPIKSARRINSEVKKTVKPRKVKQSVTTETKVNDSGVKGVENSTENTDNEGKGTESTVKGTKIVTKILKKTKTATKTAEDSETKESQGKETSGIINKVSPKVTKRQSDSPKSGKTTKAPIQKKTANKDSENKSSPTSEALLLWDPKNTKPKKNLGKDSGENFLLKTTIATDNKTTKTFSDSKNSIDLTIDEVIASMLSDTELEESDEEEGKTTRNKKMLVGERSFCDLEIKKEAACEEVTKAREESPGIEQITQLQNSIPISRKSNTPSQRSLRNGKLRQLSDSGISMDLEMKKRGRLNSDEPASLEQYPENILDETLDTESCFSKSSINESRTNVLSSKDDISSSSSSFLLKKKMLNEKGLNEKTLNEIAEVMEIVSRLENNNNGEQVDNVGEVGPTLRSKVKTRSNDEIKVDNMKIEDSKSTIIVTEDTLDETKKPVNMDLMKKDITLTKIPEMPKCRRSSLNTEVKKINPFAFSTDKTDGSSKSHIDQMIESIKLTIAKSIESKIYGQEKGKAFEGLSKSFEVPKMEEIVAPLSTEIQKVALEERVEEDKPNISKKEIKSDSSENSVPKVADTAKEIEKLVMGDIKLADTQSIKKEGQVESSDGSSSCKNNRSSDKIEVITVNMQGDETIHQTTSTDESEKSVGALLAVQVENEKAVTKRMRGSSKSVERNLDLDNSRKPGKSKTTQEISSEEKTDCGDTEKEISNCESTEKEILKPEKALDNSIDDLIDKTVDSESSITLNVSAISEDVETLESISRDVEALVAENQSKDKSDEGVNKPQKVPTTQMEIEDQEELSIKQVSQPSKNIQEESVSLGNKETLCKSTENETVYRNNHLLTDDCDIVTATNAQTKLADLSEEAENKNDKAQNNDNSSSLMECQAEGSVEKNENLQISEKTEDPTSLKEEEQKEIVEEKKRVLRAREKQKKTDIKLVSPANEIDEEKGELNTETHRNGSILSDEKVDVTQTLDNTQNDKKEEENHPEVTVRTRRSRDGKKPVSNSNWKSRRNRKEVKKSDQQNKEETLLDNEVATINENKLVNKYRKSVEGKETIRGCSVPSTNDGKNQKNKIQRNTSSNRSKSENDLENMQDAQRSNTGSFVPKDSRNENSAVDDEKTTKTPDNLQKDSDDTSTSGESLSSIIQETPEEKARKETVFRLLGLESWEKAAERLNHQKARREQSSGTLKMRFQKGREKDKMRSRSPLKMVLKQGRTDGEGDSLEFYTIQKEFGTSGVGESSSGANRKLTTNHRHSCDEDNEEPPSKDRQSLVIPEKSSSFSIHPGRCCRDVCTYCFGKFGSLDTPMHLAQMKSDARRQKILNIERHLTKDSCLCDACYRHIDRKANQSPTNVQTKPSRQLRQFLVPKCCARGCGEPARHHVRRRWLQKVKVGLKNEVDINWESSQLTSMSFCVTHYSKVAKFLNCGLCKRRLQKNQSFSLNIHEANELNQYLKPQGIEIPTTVGTFICKLCRCFTSLQLKYKNVDNMHKTNKEFCKKYKAKILNSRHSGEMENEMDDMPSSQGSKDKDKEKRKKSKGPSQTKNSRSSSKSPDATSNTTNLVNPNLEKSIPKPSQEESPTLIAENERTDQPEKIDIKTSANTSSTNETSGRTDTQFYGIERTIEKLKKRKALEALGYTNTNTNVNANANTSTNTNESSEGVNVVEILAMDKEVTLTRLPKRPRTNNDITPAVQRLGANPSISVRTLFPGEEEMNLHANIEFGNIREVTPQGWEKCATMIQYDRDTKLLWQELQRPYGNQSSFLRHLILLEKYYRSGDLVLAPNASRNAINYSTSVHNRLISYEGPEKMDEPIMEPMSMEYSNTRRLSGGFVVERDRVPPTNTNSFLGTSTPNLPSTSQASKISPSRLMKLNPGVSIMKKPPPNLQRLSFPSTSGSSALTPKKKDSQKPPMPSGGKVFQMSEPEFKRLQNLKRQKQMIGDKNSRSSNNGPSAAGSPPGLKSVSQYQKAHFAAQTQFQKHLRMQQEMLNRQSRSDFEPLVCDMRTLSNENTPSQNFLGNLNLPKSIQVTTKPPIPILPKIPKSLTVIPQTVPRPTEK